MQNIPPFVQVVNIKVKAETLQVYLQLHSTFAHCIFPSNKYQSITAAIAFIS